MPAGEDGVRAALRGLAHCRSAMPRPRCSSSGRSCSVRRWRPHGFFPGPRAPCNHATPTRSPRGRRRSPPGRRRSLVVPHLLDAYLQAQRLPARGTARRGDQEGRGTWSRECRGRLDRDAERERGRSSELDARLAASPNDADAQWLLRARALLSGGARPEQSAGRARALHETRARLHRRERRQRLAGEGLARKRAVRGAGERSLFVGREITLSSAHAVRRARNLDLQFPPRTIFRRIRRFVSNQVLVRQFVE